MSMADISALISKEDLIAYIAKYGKVKFLFFWGHQKSADGSVSESCLSQWYETGFKVDDIYYPTAEHYMMAEKARLFNDEKVLQDILMSKHPGDAKKLGRAVRNYQDEVWKKQRLSIVIRGNEAKFSQNKELKNFLLNTRERALVEASPRDRIWGVGMEKSNPEIENPARWKGLNLLGFALMATRKLLLEKHND